MVGEVVVAAAVVVLEARNTKTGADELSVFAVGSACDPSFPFDISAAHSKCLLVTTHCPSIPYTHVLFVFTFSQ